MAVMGERYFAAGAHGRAGRRPSNHRYSRLNYIPSPEYTELRNVLNFRILNVNNIIERNYADS